MRTAWYHFCRACERNHLPVDDIFSPSERAHLDARYQKGVVDAHAVMNFVVWRRSALYILLFCSAAFNCLSIHGISDAQAAQQGYLAKAKFVLNYTLWAEEQLAQGPRVPCAEIDAGFGQFLNQTLPTIAELPNSGVRLRSNPGRTCSDLASGDVEARCAASTGETLKQLVLESAACGWQVCSRPLSEVCPAACSGQATCVDTREQSVPSFLGFSKAFLEAIMYRLRAQAAKVTVVRTVLVTVLQWLALAGVLAATISWSNWRRSWRMLLGSWLLTFSTPFLTSTLPTRLFVDWGSTSEDVLEFVRLAKEHYNLEERAEQMLGPAADVCNQKVPALRQNWESAQKKVGQLCSIMRRMKVPFTSIDDRGRDACNAMPRYVDNVEKSIELTQTICNHFNKMWQQEGSALSSLQEQIQDAIQQGAEHAQLSTEMTLALANALSAFKEMWPTAIALAPGLIKGAIRAKIIIPEASMPGVFIVLLPWLYTPMSWSLYNILMQIMGDGFVLVSLFLFAFYPLAYSIIGWTFNVVSPMELPKVKKVVRYLDMSTQAIMLVSLTMAIIAITKLYNAYQENLVLISEMLEGVFNDIIRDQLVNPQGMVVIVLSVFTKSTLTSLSAVDWMMRESGTQRRFENMLQERESLRDELEGSVAQLWQKRRVNLDAILALSKGPRDANGRQS